MRHWVVFVACDIDVSGIERWCGLHVLIQDMAKSWYSCCDKDQYRD
jgi:hypothetical protein